MQNKNKKTGPSYFQDLSKFDINLFLYFLLILIFCYLTEAYFEYKEDHWYDLYKISDFVKPLIAYKFLFASIILFLISTLIRHATKNSEEKSWRYLAIVAFSILGSVVVSLLTLDKPSEAPFIWALAISLFHLGYWCWKREHIETSQYQADIKTSTLKLEKIINIMPNELAFKVMGKDTSAIFGNLSILSNMSANAICPEDKKYIRDETKKQLKIALESMCQIASLWTTSKPRLFEANIMFVKPSELVSEIPNVREAFERGKYFFPDLTSLETIHNSCEKCLYVIPELAISNEKNDTPVDVKPLLLPVGIKSKMHPGSIKGAPEAVEKGVTISIDDVNDIVSNLPANYVAKQKHEIQNYFDAQTNCGSILSVPLLIHYSATSQNDNDYSVDAVINLYRPEKGLIKSPVLFQDFTKPLVLIIANLLYLYLNNDEVSEELNSNLTTTGSENASGESNEV